MKVTIEIYRGVPLTLGRTKKMIDTIIEKKGTISNKELAELVGLDSWRSLIGIFRLINTEKKPKYVVKLAKNTFKNYYGEGKDKARDLIGKAIMSTKRQNSNILTLPADQWIMERNILDQKNGYKFTAVERDKKTFDKMVINLSKKKNRILLDSIIGLENKSIGDVIENAKEDTYSNAILDYCGFIDSFYDEINHMMSKNLVKKGGYITITLAENDRALNNSIHNNNYTKTLINNCYSDDEEVTGEIVTNYLIKNLIFRNNGYRLIKKFGYKDTKMKMLLFIIQRIDE